ncbi:MAG: 50S ribosomal protein L29 [Deltaproteobacteria bacterium]|nr:50S ribosomal protein L29 [Deltaproteobacteria bacterium]
MDSDLGVDPEVLVFKEVKNHISIRLSKRFKCARHYQQFDIVHPSINKYYKEQLENRYSQKIEELGTLRFDIFSGKDTNTSKLRQLKKEIARIKTIMKEETFSKTAKTGRKKKKIDPTYPGQDSA